MAAEKLGNSFIFVIYFSFSVRLCLSKSLICQSTVTEFSEEVGSKLLWKPEFLF